MAKRKTSTSNKIFSECGKRYFTGVPCKKGHIAWRSVSNGSCFDCSAINRASTYWRNPEKAKMLSKEYADNNKEKILEKRRKKYRLNPEPFKAATNAYRIANRDADLEKKRIWYSENSEQDLARRKQWSIDNPGIDSARWGKFSTKWYAENPGAHNAESAKRYASQKQRTPIWADIDKIREIYNACPKGYHVDHIIPLQGKKVSGLHVYENLQIIPAFVNWSKNNKYKIE